MAIQTQIPSLASLEYFPFLDSAGTISPDLEKAIGVYAIFDRDRVLQFVGYSRNIAFSLKQHLIRQPDYCYWLKVTTIARPSRTILEQMRQAWIEENGSLPTGNTETGIKSWIEPIDIKFSLTDAQKAEYNKQDELGQRKLLKNLARELEEKIKSKLVDRGVNFPLRFNPKIKDQGLLDLKPE